MELELKLQISQTNYKKLVQKIYNNTVENQSKEEIISLLSNSKKEFEMLMDEACDLEITTENAAKINDLKYFILNDILFANDLLTFYSEDLQDRFKLRVENYMQRERLNLVIRP